MKKIYGFFIVLIVLTVAIFVCDRMIRSDVSKEAIRYGYLDARYKDKIIFRSVTFDVKSYATVIYDLNGQYNAFWTICPFGEISFGLISGFRLTSQ